jgi:hypothetical protein
MPASKRFKYTSYKNTFSSILQVMKHMEEIQMELQNTDLVNLQYFNQTYYIITKCVYAEVDKNYFINKDSMHHLDIVFAQYYFNALKKYTQNETTTPAWEITFDFCRSNNSVPLIYLAQGVNAHVNNDLGIALYDVIKNRNFKSDYKKVNVLIYQSLGDVITYLRISIFYKPFMHILIKHWRKNAWNNYQQLKTDPGKIKYVEDSAKDKALALSEINSAKDLYHLYKVL